MAYHDIYEVIVFIIFSFTSVIGNNIVCKIQYIIFFKMLIKTYKTDEGSSYLAPLF